LAALALRGAALWVFRGELARDPDGYRHTAQSLVEQGVYAPDELASLAAGRPIPGAYRPPLYPLLLAALRAISPAEVARIAALQLALGLGTVALTAVLARRWGLGRWAWLAALLTAADPLLLAHSASVMTETLAAFLAVAGLVAADAAITAIGRKGEKQRWVEAVGWAGLAGLVAGLAVLCRPTFLPWAIGLPVLYAWAGWRRSIVPGTPATAWRPSALACLAGLALALAPWMIRNWVSLGAPLMTTTHGGYTFYLANNREFFDYLRGSPTAAWNSEGFNERWRVERARGLGPGPWPQGTERGADRLAYERGQTEIAADPAGFLGAAAARLARLWGVVPEPLRATESRSRRWQRWAVGAWYALVLLLAVGGVCWLGIAAARSAAGDRVSLVRLAPALWLLASFTAVHAVYWTNLRMRAPLMPAVAAFAAAGARWVACRKWL
jgi:hypothetical protein